MSTTEPAVEVYEMTAEEWDAAAQRGLQRIGYTYEELEAQARDRKFATSEAHKLWMMIGDRLSEDVAPRRLQYDERAL
jgi:hypothetical protein